MIKRSAKFRLNFRYVYCFWQPKRGMLKGHFITILTVSRYTNKKAKRWQVYIARRGHRLVLFV